MLAAVLAGLYATTCYRTLGPGDSGEFSVALSTWGVPHSPGYPLLCLIGNLVAPLAGHGHAAFAFNLLNAAFALGGATLLHLAVTTVTGRPWAGFLAGLALGLAPVFWEQALAVEVVSLNALFASALLYCFARVLTRTAAGKSGRGAFVASVALAATALTHHATIALVAVPVLLVEIFVLARASSNGKWSALGARGVGLAIVAGILACLPLLYLPLAARHDPPLNWGNPRDLGSLVHVLLRADFGAGVLLAPNLAAAEVLQHGESVSPLGGKPLGVFLGAIPGQLGWGLVVCVLVGLVAIARRNRPLLVAVLLLAAGQWLFFSRVNTPLTPLYLGATQRFHVLAYVVLAFVAGIGLAEVFDFAGARHRAAPAIVGVVMLAGTIALAASHVSLLDMRRNTFAEDLGANFLEGMPARALVMTDGDLFRNGALYQQACLGVRRDLALVDPGMMAAPWYVTQIRRRGTLRLPDTMSVYTGDPATGVKTWLDLNLEVRPGGPGRPVVAIKLIDASAQSSHRMLPMGLWSRIVPREERVDLGRWADDFSQVVSRWRVASIERTFAPTSWEGSQSVFYRYALGCLAASRDMAAAFAPATPLPEHVPALDVAGHWTGTARAEFLAYEADEWRSALEDSLVPADGGSRATARERAAGLANASLAIDSTNVQALQTLAWLVAHAPGAPDVLREVRLRERIVAQRPGDVGELSAYLGAVRRCMADPATRNTDVGENAERVRQRAVRVFEIAEKLCPDPGLAQVRAQLSAPFRF